MRYWSWHIPTAYRAYLIELGIEGHPLYADFRKIQYTEQGTLPQAYEIYPNVFLWRNYGHRIIYERMASKQLLILSSLARM